MKIIHLIEPGGGGTLRHVIDLASAQAQAGDAVTIIYSPLRLEPLFAPQLFALRKVILYPLPMRRAPHPDDIQNLLSLIQIIRKTNPDILHAHSTKAGMLARLARIFVTTKVIFTPHALMTLDPETRAIKKLCYSIYEKILSPLMHKMIVLSNVEHDQALALGIPANKIVLGLNGIAPLPPVDRDTIRRNWQVADGKVVVGFVGRLSHQKNPQLALKSFALARKAQSNLKLVVIGDGEFRQDCTALAEQLNISADIIWMGAADAKMLYAGMDLLLITSRYEGMAYSFIEALHAGLPIITTAVGGSDRCVIHGQTGLIMPANTAALSDGIIQLSQDAVLRDAMHFAGRSLAREFTINQLHSTTGLFYNDQSNQPVAYTRAV